MPVKLVRFGLFEFNTATRKLHKQGRLVPLQRQPMQVLEVLLEDPGRLVSRSELRERLWPSHIFVDFDLGLTGAIKRLRLALSDSADNPRFIETVPKAGYRFLAPVQVVSDPEGLTDDSAARSISRLDGAATRPYQEDLVGKALASRPRTRYLVLGLLTVMVVAGFAYFLRPLAPLPRVTRITKLSTTGKAWRKESLLSDGTRVYYTELTDDGIFQLRQVLLNGTDDMMVSGLPASSLIRALTPDHTTFLAIPVAAAQQQDVPSPVYVVPVVGGPARRLGELQTGNFAWSPDGSQLAFAREERLFISGADGAGERGLATLPGYVMYPRWSPEGKRLRCTVLDDRGESTIWEVAVSDGKSHALQFSWPGSPAEGFGEWSPDGKYFVFTSQRDGMSDLWAIDDNPDVFHRRRRDPVQLTAGPIGYFRPLPSQDGRHIYALGMETGGQLLRYDAARKEFVNFLGGRSADHLDFTSDGAWVAYISYPDGTLWRSRSDGSQSLQLTFAPMRATNPHWAPDGKQILFVARTPGQLPKICTISLDGGNAEPVVSEPHAQTSPSWSPDGKEIFYGREPQGENKDIALYHVDVHSHRTEKITGSEGLYAPLWSPNGKRLVAQSAQSDHLLVLFDLATGTRRPILRHKADYPAWSVDSKYLYVNTLLAEKPALLRVNIRNGQEEKVTDVHFQAVGNYGAWSGLAPDGSLLLLKGREQTDVYTLTVTPQ